MKTKTTLVLSALLMCANSLWAAHETQRRTEMEPMILTPADLTVVDEYSVIKVNGQIVYVKSGSDMATGDVFKSDEALTFKTTESRAAVISEIKGRFVLSASEEDEGVNLGPAMNNISSRAGALLNMIDLQNHFKDEYLILDKIELEISEKSFPQDDYDFFYMQYTYNGEEIHKKLEHDGNKLIIDKAELFKIDGLPIDKPDKSLMKLWYMESEAAQATLINSFKPVFPDLDELKTEVGVLLNELSDDKDRATKIAEITAYLTEFYAKPEKENLEGWLDENFEL